MLAILKSDTEGLKEINKIENNSWIKLITPTEEEINSVYEKTKIHYNLFKKVLDRHETARVEIREKSVLFVLSIPIKKEYGFRTVPLGIILTTNNIVTLVNNEELNKTIFTSFMKRKNIDPENKVEFILNLFLEITSHYQTILNELQILLEIKEKNLLKATSNEDMKELLEISKSLVYFIKALNMNEVVLEKIMQGNILNMDDNDRILLEDAIIENRQAINMATLYQDLLKSVMDSYGTIISNNLNGAMKFLTGITIVFTIPTMVSSFMGMNVHLGFFNNSEYAFIILVIISLILSILTAWIFKRKNWL